MNLAEPPTRAQLAVAGRLHAGLKQWRASEEALALLSVKVPGFSEKACLLKTVAVNAIYGTNVLAVVRMAGHVHSTMKKRRRLPIGVDMVTDIAALPEEHGKSGRRFTSFASKFCHFFVDAELFPIYDEAACTALTVHLGTRPKRHDYQGFCKAFRMLRQESELRCSTRELDRYLWLTGMYMRWLRQREKGHPQVNAELLDVFRHPTRAQAANLNALLPAGIRRVF